MTEVENIGDFIECTQTQHILPGKLLILSDYKPKHRKWLKRGRSFHFTADSLIDFTKWRSGESVDVVDDPLADFAGAIFGSTFHLDFRSADTSVERSVDSLTDEGTFGLEVKVLEQHSH